MTCKNKHVSEVYMPEFSKAYFSQDLYDFLVDNDLLSDTPGPFYYMPNSKLWEGFDEYLKSKEVEDDE